MTRTELPHEPYIDRVAHILADSGAEPAYVHCETADGVQLDAVMSDWPAGVVSEEHWPHGVYLGWGQHSGWQLVEAGGGRNITPLSEDSGTYGSPRQVTADVIGRLISGLPAGPIAHHGGRRWDPAPIEAAVAAWERDA